MDNKANIGIYFDKRRPKKNEKYPVKLLLTYERVPKLYRLNIDLSEQEWEKIHTEKPRGEYRDIKIKLDHLVYKANKIAEQIQSNFTFERFERLYFSGTPYDIYSLFDIYINKLKNEGCINTAVCYNSSLKSLKSFAPKLQIKEINPQWLNSYEKHLLAQGKSITTVSIYLRNLRTILNIAIKEGLLKIEFYPFGRHKYVIPQSRNIKKALQLTDIQKIFEYTPIPNTWQEKSRDLWLFMYLGNGLNVKDLCKLKYRNIDNNTIKFGRSKTAQTKRINSREIVIYMTDNIKAIIERHGQKPVLPNSYIFPFLEENISPEEEALIIKRTTKNINKCIGTIAKEQGINVKVTTYSARHSFSTILKRSGASVEFISEQLGHSDLKTTERYLDSFEDDLKAEWAKKLTDFNKQ